MNSRDRAVLDRIDDVIRTIGSLTPRNPADVATISGNLRVATAASKELVAAISAMRGRDWREVGERLQRAERIVAPPVAENGANHA